MKVTNLNLKNVNIPVVFERSNTLPVVSLRLVFCAAGSLYDENKPGLAMLSANMLNEGCASISSQEYAKELEMRAINIYSSIDKERLTIEVECLKEHFDFALSMLSKTLLKPNLNNDDFQKRILLTLGDISNKNNDNDYLARVNLMKHIYKGTPLSSPSIGNDESIKSIKIEDIDDFLSNYLDLSNLYIVFGGDIDESSIDSLKEVLEPLKVGKKRQLPYFRPITNIPDTCMIKKSEQAYVYFASPFDVGFDDKFKAKVATFILGEGGFGSRIMEEIRVKRGLAYSAYAKAIISHSHSYVYGYLQTKNSTCNETIEVVRDEFKKFIENGVSKKELEQAKKFLLGSLPLVLETLFSRLNIADNEYYEYGKIGAFIKNLDNIKNLKLVELNDFIASHSEISELNFSVLRNEN